jgi:hypothetical protein
MQIDDLDVQFCQFFNFSSCQEVSGLFCVKIGFDGKESAREGHVKIEDVPKYFLREREVT